MSCCVQILIIEPWPSGRAASLLNHRIISVALGLTLLCVTLLWCVVNEFTKRLHLAKEQRCWALGKRQGPEGNSEIPE